MARSLPARFLPAGSIIEYNGKLGNVVRSLGDRNLFDYVISIGEGRKIEYKEVLESELKRVSRRELLSTK
jgi:hypothetical protein